MISPCAGVIHLNFKCTLYIKLFYHSAECSRRAGRSARIGPSPRSTILAPPSQSPATVLALHETPRALIGRTANRSSQTPRESPRTRLPSHPHGQQLFEQVICFSVAIFIFLLINGFSETNGNTTANQELTIFR